LFVIVALGETLLTSGATLSSAETWNPAVLLALLATFIGTLAMWWLYFGTSSKDATVAITKADDPGRIGAYFHYVHAILIAGVITTAVGNDLILAHPDALPAAPQVAVLLAGPALFLLGSAIYKRVVYGVLPGSHLAGALVLLAAVPVAFVVNMLVTGWLSTAVMLVVSFWRTARAR
jgi:low temperature requirement protein LtrA